jgi:protein-S-isoprenylcysteine O-methyltransferase Ste14
MSPIARKTWLGLLQMIGGLGLLIFIPAGDFDYWQGWIYLSLFAACCGAIIFYLWHHDPALLARRMKAGARAETETSQKIIHGFITPAVLAAIILPALDHRFGWSRVAPSFTFAGYGLELLGFAIIFFTFRQNSFAAATIEIAAEHKVISTGLYGWIRHPMYAGVLLIFLGTPVAMGSWYGYGAFAGVVAALVWRLIDEERILRVQLPGYEEYCHKVRWRLMPYVY